MPEINTNGARGPISGDAVNDPGSDGVLVTGPEAQEAKVLVPACDSLLASVVTLLERIDSFKDKDSLKGGLKSWARAVQRATAKLIELLPTEGQDDLTKRSTEVLRSIANTREGCAIDIVESGRAEKIHQAMRGLFGCLHHILHEFGVDHQCAPDLKPPKPPVPNSPSTAELGELEREITRTYGLVSAWQAKWQELEFEDADLDLITKVLESDEEFDPAKFGLPAEAVQKVKELPGYRVLDLPASFLDKYVMLKGLRHLEQQCTLAPERVLRQEPGTGLDSAHTLRELRDILVSKGAQALVLMRENSSEFLGFYFYDTCREDLPGDYADLDKWAEPNIRENLSQFGGQFPKYGIAERVGVSPEVVLRGLRGALLHALMVEEAAFKGLDYMIGQVATYNGAAKFHHLMGWEEVLDGNGQPISRKIPVILGDQATEIELVLLKLKVPPLKEAQALVRKFSVFAKFFDCDPFRQGLGEAPAPESTVFGIRPKLPA